MDREILPAQPETGEIEMIGGPALPALVVQDGERTTRRFLEFFAATIRNRNTRAAYARAVNQFLSWCEAHRIESLYQIQPIVVAGYIEQLTSQRAAPTVKQHLAAIRTLFDWLVTGHVLDTNPAHSVRGPKHVVDRGKTPVLTSDQARQLLNSIDTANIVGLRDRAVIGVMVYTFARVGAVIRMEVGDYYQDGKRWWVRLREKGGKRHQVPAHHNAEAYVDAYLDEAGIAESTRSPLFRTISKSRQLTANAMTRHDAFRMIRRRAKAAGLPTTIGCHTFRATGITAYMENGGTVENAQKIAAHSSPRTTKLYDRTRDEITLDEIEKIQI